MTYFYKRNKYFYTILNVSIQKLIIKFISTFTQKANYSYERLILYQNF